MSTTDKALEDTNAKTAEDAKEKEPDEKNEKAADEKQEKAPDDAKKQEPNEKQEKAPDDAKEKVPNAKKEKASDDTVDPQSSLREECKRYRCHKYVERLEKCDERVKGKKETKETCMEEVIDVFHCVDHCASHSLFSKLK
ncbi:cytochrome b-c1 complex subunit 6-like protein [Leptotrombidium deliense]|uniref:Cytochrome b-c1 complex subunit 6-like protein n=1 Tax=Leptotrombidium deliense TaxID=299467 RepID=A0A443SSY2_9ACAR|nr:cytochrome b-c1 complex subunit 6-like protein [Leptotrombidium deliense]